ncbi:MAG: dipeptidase [Planctomycetota bacterium]|nr:dipeptidase [Planctomycetota bacterium]
MLSKKIIEYLASHRQEHLEQLSELLRFPSVSSQSAHEADGLACAEHIAGHLRGLGFLAELRPWRKHPILLARSTPDIAEKSAPTVLIYAHYDVQPPDPVDLWTSPPFEPTVRDDAIYARGASDDKGLMMSCINGCEAFIRTAGRLPTNVLFFVEGEEEMGSPDLEDFVTSAADDLKSDYALVMDLGFFAPGVPTILTGLRGLVYLELTLTGPSADLHSGQHGGAVVNPINALAGMISAMHDKSGKVTLPGFYDDVIEPDRSELDQWESLPFDEGRYIKEVGVEPVGGELDRSVLERRWSRPTLDCNGIIGGYQGEGAKTVLPAKATAKISMRLVPNQRPDKVLSSFDKFVSDNTPAGVRASVEVSSRSRPVVVPPESPAITAVKDAMLEAFGAETAIARAGGSVPIAELIQRVLKVDPIVTGFALPDDNIHSPNEHLQLEQFHTGAVATAAMLNNLAGITR